MGGTQPPTPMSTSGRASPHTYMWLNNHSEVGSLASRGSLRLRTTEGRPSSSPRRTRGRQTLQNSSLHLTTSVTDLGSIGETAKLAETGTGLEEVRLGSQELPISLLLHQEDPRHRHHQQQPVLFATSLQDTDHLHSQEVHHGPAITADLQEAPGDA